MQRTSLTEGSISRGLLQFAATGNSRVHLMVAANGSGAFDFENLAGEPSGSLSGTVRWTCS